MMTALMKHVRSASYCEGMSRALVSDSETTALVIAVLMPTLEVTWETLANGCCQLRVNYMFVLMDVDGEMHPPKDENRRELGIPPALEQDLRQRVLVDAQKMIDRGVPLASGWYRQLGLIAEADAIAACELAGVKPGKGKAKKPKAGKAGVTKKNHFNVSHVVMERASTGRAKKWFLVEWEGYHPSWEVERIMGKVGSPLQTWERLGVIRRTEAYHRTAQRRSFGSS